MSFATDTLALAQAALQKALSGQTVKFNDRLWTAQNINELELLVVKYQAKVDAETARAEGKSSRGPIRFNL